MSWEETEEAATTSARRRVPRHRAASGQDPQRGPWWQPERAAAGPRRLAVPDDEADTPTVRITAAPGATGTRAVVGPWTMLTQTPTTASIATTDDRDVATPHTLGWSRRGATMSTAAPAAATNFPPGTAKSEKGLRTYLADTGALSGRQVLMWWRDKSTALQTLLFPALSMVMFKVVLGDSIGRVTGQNSAFGTVPLVVLVAAMFGSLAGGVRLTVERDTGLLTRLYVLPVHRAADLSARVISELVRVLAATAVLTSLGYLIGWRFNQGFLSAVGIFAVALLYGGAFAILVLAIALVGKNLPLVPIITLVSSLFMFFNSGFSPVSAYPKFLQPIVGNQPMTCAIDTMRALATGAPLGDSLIKTVLWAVGAIVVFTIPAIKGYRRAASGR